MAPTHTERVVILEEKTAELERGSIETNQILKSVSTRINSLCISQAKIFSTLEGLVDKVEGIRDFSKERLDKADSKIEVYRDSCNKRHEETLKLTSKISVKQKIIYTVASLLGAGLISLVIKLISL